MTKKKGVREWRAGEMERLNQYRVVTPPFRKMANDLREKGIPSKFICSLVNTDPSTLRQLRTKQRKDNGDERVPWRLGEAIITLWETYCRNK